MIETATKTCAACGKPLPPHIQKPDEKGHRKREYCNDVCKQKTYLTRKKMKRLQQEWGGYPPETQRALREISLLAGKGVANRAASAISHEFYRRNTPRSVATNNTKVGVMAHRATNALATERKFQAMEWQDHLTSMGVQVTHSKTGYALSYHDIRAQGPSLDLAMIDFVAACLETRNRWRK